MAQQAAAASEGSITNVKCEKPYLLGDGRRPGDVSCDIRGHTHAFDVRVVNGSMPSKIDGTLRDPNFHIIDAELKKTEFYRYDCNQHGISFAPFALDALGRLGPSAHSIISMLSNAIDDTQGARALFRQYWIKRICASVQIYYVKRLLANQQCRSPRYLAHKTQRDMNRHDDHLNGLPIRPFRNSNRRVAFVRT